MAATIHQLSSCGIAKEDCRKPMAVSSSNASPDFSQRFPREPKLWTDSWGNGELGSQGVPLPSEIASFIASLRSCTRKKDLIRGTRLHNDLLQRGLAQECSDALVTMYAKCGKLSTAKGLLDLHKSSDAISWTAVIAGYARKGQGQNALDCFEQMQKEGIFPDAVTYSCALKACATIRAADKGKQIHDEIARQGLLQNNVVLGGALVDMYAKCGSVLEAHRVLKELPVRDVVSWSALIRGYAQEGEAEQALNCLKQMLHEGIFPDSVAYACALKACAMIRASSRGKQIHMEIARQGLLQNDIVLGNALVDMYSKCGDVSEAQRVLEELPSRDVISWNSLIAGYVQEGETEQAMNCLEQMQHEGILPDAVTYTCTLKACATIRAAGRGKQIHEEIARLGLLHNNTVLANALIDMYAKCGDVSEARKVLEELSSRDVVSWSALIAGYVQKGEAEQALNCLEQMRHEGIDPDAVTYACLLQACSMIKAAARGKEIHKEIARQGLLQSDIVLANALVDMYAKCGDISEARRVLEELPSRNVACWSALIAGYSQEGKAEHALNCLEQMQQEGILPDARTVACVLDVCSHRGLLEEGQELFSKMTTIYGVKPNLECYTCMIDLFGRAGHLEKAVRLIQEIPSSDYTSIWHALMHACRKWADVNVGGWAFEQAIKLNKSDGTAYVLMANICAEVGMKEKAKTI